MTAGVAFVCEDGFVFASDRQLTSDSGFKFEERKIFRFLNENWSLVFSYAGNQDTAKLFFQRLFDSFREKIPQTLDEFPRKLVLGVLEDVFKDKLSKEIETLIGITVKNYGAHLYRTKETKVVAATVAECIGVGDSSAIRYVCELLVRFQPQIEEAKILASYIISVANRYVEGCSGGPDITVLWPNGRINELSGEIFPNQTARFQYYEEQVGRVFRELLLKERG